MGGWEVAKPLDCAVFPRFRDKPGPEISFLEVVKT
jgi:hypothetical protein